MKATELRIGNWIEIKDQEDKTFAQIEGIGNLQQVAGQLWSIEELEPIPLTEEWLERFGFISDPYHDTYIKGYFTLNCDKTRGKLELWLNNVTGKVLYVKQVHKLQNLFFEIEGEELQLK